MAIQKNISISSIEYRGHGVGRTDDGRVIFVENALPGEVVDVRVTEKKKRYSFGYPLEYHIQSPLRVAPFCDHFVHCGGCKWQYLPYEHQVRFKREFVEQVFQRIGKVQTIEIEETLGCPTDRYYRNKMEFSFTTDRWLTESEVADGDTITDRRGLGLHVQKRYDKILDISHCYLQQTNELRNALAQHARGRAYSFFDPVAKKGLLRGLVVRTSLLEETMVILVLSEPDHSCEQDIASFLTQEFPGVTSIYVAYNATMNDALVDQEMHLITGKPTIRERCGSLTLAIHPRSFYQTNPIQAERLYETIRLWAELSGSETVYDLYSGIGSIALFLAPDARTVLGIETVAEAVANARENAVANGIENCTFRVGAVETELSRDFVAERGRPDLVVVDPPRAGLKPTVVETLRLIKPKRILYVSCNPATQARDIAALRPAYALARLKPVDMFPHTYHIETIADLRAE